MLGNTSTRITDQEMQKRATYLSYTGEIQNTKNKDVGYVCKRIIDLEMQKRVT